MDGFLFSASAPPSGPRQDRPATAGKGKGKAARGGGASRGEPAAGGEAEGFLFSASAPPPVGRQDRPSPPRTVLAEATAGGSGGGAAGAGTGAGGGGGGVSVGSGATWLLGLGVGLVGVVVAVAAALPVLGPLAAVVGGVTGLSSGWVCVLYLVVPLVVVTVPGLEQVLLCRVLEARLALAAEAGRSGRAGQGRRRVPVTLLVDAGRAGRAAGVRVVCVGSDLFRSPPEDLRGWLAGTSEAGRGGQGVPCLLIWWLRTPIHAVERAAFVVCHGIWSFRRLRWPLLIVLAVVFLVAAWLWVHRVVLDAVRAVVDGVVVRLAWGRLGADDAVAMRALAADRVGKRLGPGSPALDLGRVARYSGHRADR